MSHWCPCHMTDMVFIVLFIAHINDVPLFDCSCMLVLSLLCFPCCPVTWLPIVEHVPVGFGHMSHLVLVTVRDTRTESDWTVTCSIILTACVVFSHRLVILHLFIKPVCCHLAFASFCMSFASRMFVVMIMSLLTCSFILLCVCCVLSQIAQSHSCLSFILPALEQALACLQRHARKAHCFLASLGTHVR